MGADPPSTRSPVRRLGGTDPGGRVPGGSAHGGRHVFIVAGESSGDIHGSHLMEEMLGREPDLGFSGLGGERMRDAGMRSLGRSEEIAVVGLVEVLRILPRAKAIFDELVEHAARNRPDVAVLIDAPDFNLRLARKLADLGIPVVYYVSPQIWAWRRGRVRKMRGMIERMLVLFPFEESFYREAGIDVVHVGHPLLDVVPEVGETDASGAPSSDWILGLLPGSRNSEVRKILPTMVEASRRVHASIGSPLRLLRAGGVDPRLVEELIGDAPIEVVDARRDTDRFRELRSCRAVLCASGTATLEVGLLGIPMVVCYRMAPLTHAIAKRLVEVDHISLVNLVLQRAVVPELVQDRARPDVVAKTALDLMVDGDQRERLLAGLAELRPALGDRGASAKAADAVLEVLERTGSAAGSSVATEVKRE